MLAVEVWPRRGEHIKCNVIMKDLTPCCDPKRRYGQRFATVEPVFGNIRHNQRLNRFTLRGKRKVDTQWKLYCLVHNIEKLVHYGNLQ